MSLSATLLADDQFVNKMYDIAYPTRLRYVPPLYHKYVNAVAVLFTARDPGRIRTKEYGSNNYSHTAFEKSILKDPLMLSSYLNLIERVYKGAYIDNYKPGYRSIVFCASIEMCTRVKDYLKAKYHDLEVLRYVEEDPWQHVLDANTLVSTLQSAGTALDMDGLSTVIMTTAISSSQTNIQGFGRMREPKDGSTPTFLYFVCDSVDKHVEYHERKRVLLQERAMAYKSIHMGIAL